MRQHDLVMSAYLPIDPFEAQRQAARSRVEESGIWPILYVGSNGKARGSLFGRLVDALLHSFLLEEVCPECRQRMLIRDANKWRMTGAGLICDVCAGAPPDSIVAADNHEVLALSEDLKVMLPERAEQFYDAQLRTREQQEGSIAEEAKQLDWAIEREPSDAWLYVHRALKCADHSELVEYLNRAVEAAPVDARIRCWRACRLFGRAEHEETVIRDLEKAIELDPGLADAYCQLASAYAADDPRSDEVLKQACELFPRNASVHYHRAVYLLGQRREAEAKGAIGVALELDPDNKIYLHVRRACCRAAQR